MICPKCAEEAAKVCEAKVIPSYQAGGVAVESANHAHQYDAAAIRALAAKPNTEAQADASEGRSVCAETDSRSTRKPAPSVPDAMPEQQSWAEAVVECVSDSAERERLIRFYDYDELVKACLALGTLALTAKHEHHRAESAEARLRELEKPGRCEDHSFAEHISRQLIMPVKCAACGKIVSVAAAGEGEKK